MCKCINTLVDKGVIERECVYEDHDYKEKGYMIRKYQKKARKTIATNQLFQVNYCPACGEKVEGG